MFGIISLEVRSGRRQIMPEVDKSQDEEFGVAVDVEAEADSIQVDLLMGRACQEGFESNCIRHYYDKSVFGYVPEWRYYTCNQDPRSVGR